MDKRTIPLPSLMIEESTNFQCAICTRFKSRWVGQQFVAVYTNSFIITNFSCYTLRNKLSSLKETTPNKRWIATQFSIHKQAGREISSLINMIEQGMRSMDQPPGLFS